MKATRRSSVMVALCAASLFALLSGSAVHAAKETLGPAVTPQIRKLPDLVPVKLYLGGRCDLMAQIRNQGLGPVSGQVHFRYFRSGQQVGTGGRSLSLSPGASTNVKIASKTLLGDWLKQSDDWRLELDHHNEIAEANEGNNSIAATLACAKVK